MNKRESERKRRKEINLHDANISKNESKKFNHVNYIPLIEFFIL